jgi:hypothetical protein
MFFCFFLIASSRFYFQGENMKLISLLTILILAAACGKDGGGSSASSSAKNGSCSLDGRAVACESIQGADGLGVDLLDSMVDVPVKIADSDITFLADKTATSQGRRISCKTSVKNGEVYRFALRGSKLLVMTATGSFEMDRLTDGSALLGTWSWKGYEEGGTHVIKTMSFLSDTRVILKTNCEL